MEKSFYRKWQYFFELYIFVVWKLIAINYLWWSIDENKNTNRSDNDQSFCYFRDDTINSHRNHSVQHFLVNGFYSWKCANYYLQSFHIIFSRKRFVVATERMTLQKKNTKEWHIVYELFVSRFCRYNKRYEKCAFSSTNAEIV